MTDADEILHRFNGQVNRVMEYLRTTFQLPECDIEDWRQEANMRVLCYAGLVPWPTNPGRHFGLLTGWHALTNGVESEIQALLYYELRLDMCEAIGRSFDKLPPAISEDEKDISVVDIPGTRFEPSEPSFENGAINDMDEARLLRRYPLFARNVLDGVTQEKLAADLGIPLRTVERRIAGEKRSFLLTMLKRRGIVVEGDEPMHELEEAYRSLTHM